MSIVYIGIGSNLGNRQKNIDMALEKLKSRKGIEIREISSIVETEPVGDIDQPKFLNAAFRIETTLYPDELLDTLKSVEREMGRGRDYYKKRPSAEEQLKMLQEGSDRILRRFVPFGDKLPQDDGSKNMENSPTPQEPKKWGPRAIDLDILFYDDVMMKGYNLVIPHPLLHKRFFVLKPLSEIAPDLTHPVLNKPVKDLLSELERDSSNDVNQKPQTDAGRIGEFQEGR